MILKLYSLFLMCHKRQVIDFSETFSSLIALTAFKRNIMFLTFSQLLYEKIILVEHNFSRSEKCDYAQDVC